MTGPLGFLPSFLTNADAQALCSETDPDSFFPEKGGPVRAAKETCRRCELIDPCRDWALTHDEIGIWGGLSKLERRNLKKEDPAPRHRPRTWTDDFTRDAVLQLLREGWSAVDAAREFAISERTVHRIRAAYEDERKAS